MWWWTAVALASERNFERGDFMLERDRVAIDVLRAVVPDPPPQPVGSEQDRICRVSLRWDKKVIAEALGCDPTVAALSEEAVRGWNLQLSPPPASEVDLMVVWLRYPAPPSEEGASDGLQMVELGVSAVPGTELVALPADIRPAVPPRPTTLEAIRWPAELAAATGTCEVRLAIGEEGAPINLAFDVCEQQYRAPLRDAMLGWRFTPSTFGISPVRVNVPLRVNIAGGTAAFEQARAADSELRYFGGPARKDEVVVERWVPPPLPEHPPILVLHHPEYAPVEVYTLPDAPAGLPAGRCPVVAQIRSDRKIRTWAEASCDPALAGPVAESLGSWMLAPSKARASNEAYARIYATLLVTDAGPRWVVDARDVVPAEDRPLPPSVGTYLRPEPFKQVPPKRVEGEKGECVLAVSLDAKGRPREVTPTTCPAPLASSAVSAVKKWRWSPPTIDGVATSATTEVRVRFR